MDSLKGAAMSGIRRSRSGSYSPSSGSTTSLYARRRSPRASQRCRCGCNCRCRLEWYHSLRNSGDGGRGMASEVAASADSGELEEYMSTLHRQIIGDRAELHRRSSGSSTPRSQSRARASSQRERFRTSCPSTATCNNGKQRLGWPVFPCVDRAVQTYWDGVSHEERPPSQSLTCGMRPAQRLGASGGWEVDNAAVSASGFQQCSPQSCGAHPAEGLGPQQPWQVHGVSKCASGMQNPAIGTSQPSSVPPCGAQSVPGRGGYLHDEFMGATGIQQPSTIPTCGTHSAQTMGSIGMQRPSPTISGAHPAKNVFSCGGRPAHDESVAASGTQQVQEIPAQHPAPGHSSANLGWDDSCVNFASPEAPGASTFAAANTGMASASADAHGFRRESSFCSPPLPPRTRRMWSPYIPGQIMARLCGGRDWEASAELSGYDQVPVQALAFESSFRESCHAEQQVWENPTPMPAFKTSCREDAQPEFKCQDSVVPAGEPCSIPSTGGNRRRPAPFNDTSVVATRGGGGKSFSEQRR